LNNNENKRRENLNSDIKINLPNYDNKNETNYDNSFIKKNLDFNNINNQSYEILPIKSNNFNQEISRNEKNKIESQNEINKKFLIYGKIY